MASQSLWLETFASIKWALPFLDDPAWCARARTREIIVADDTDKFCRETMGANDAVQLWVELYEKPPPGSDTVRKSISLVKFGIGLSGFPGIAHGGSMMTLMDEALAFAMVATETERHTENLFGPNPAWKTALASGASITDVLAGCMVTAKLDMKFLKPVLCPGVVGIEVETIEDTGSKMRMRGIMKDGNGMPLLQADGLWIRIGKAKI